MNWGPYLPVYEALDSLALLGLPTTLPASPEEVAQALGYHLQTYEEIATKSGTDPTEFTESLAGIEGLAIRDKETGATLITYDDTILPEKRQRFTMAHELGHALLDHLGRDQSVLNMSGTKSQVDSEANCFARNFLAPAPVMEALGWTFGDEALVAEAFDLSWTAAHVRIKLLPTDLRYLDDDCKRRFCSCYAEFIKSWRSPRSCTLCGAELRIGIGTFCPICGNDKLEEKRVGRMKYDEVAVKSDGRVVRCLKCGNESIGEKDDYCAICGAPVHNTCNGDCYEQNPRFQGPCTQSTESGIPGNARYCPYCGSTTSFFTADLLEPWDRTHKENTATEKDDFAF